MTLPAVLAEQLPLGVSPRPPLRLLCQLRHGPPRPPAPGHLHQVILIAHPLGRMVDLALAH